MAVVALEILPWKILTFIKLVCVAEGGGESNGPTKICFAFLKAFDVYLGPVHTMPDKFEKKTSLLQIRLPSSLIRLYPHKKIHANRTF